MPPDERRRRSKSLAARVAIGTAISAALAALVAASLSLGLANRLVLDEEDRRLKSATALVLRELPPQSDEAALKRAVDEEVDEFASESIRIAVRSGQSLVGGDAQLPILRAGECVSRAGADASLRACASAHGGLMVVAGATRVPFDVTSALVSCLAATAVAIALAFVAGQRAARWALIPLTRLRESLGSVRADHPKADGLDGDDDCLEVAALRDALRSLVARLGEALVTARRFSADAAHELKTPLTAIRAELDLLAEEPLSTPHAEAVEKLRKRVLALGRLVERLLALATASDRSRLLTDAVALEDVTRDLLARLPPEARERVKIEARGPGMVVGDEVLLAALVENAVDNALKFSGKGSVDVTVDEPEGRVVLEVTDDGPGLSREDRERAFLPFFRTPGSRASDTSGHGIGLALVAEIATAHQGSATFVDVPATDPSGRRGARLRITLPAWSPRPVSSS
ncbi:putative two component system response sensor kinase membrane-associated protein PhoR [Labilithrix luteola]|uniref:histidine kinase n=1 Tax=Labilithrix luteola TaxID=1391654 RepID=A0A0K1Q3R4_9BACT|nr:HAMP domain-containing sensor histidine kinase [Labilithrix luteola]AKV00476.1 putative two component system response sensor kinase membrane-associated protein PhoR [Labilithrix luteola]